MAKLPNVYYMTINNGWCVIKNLDGSYRPEFEESTMFLEEDLDLESERISKYFGLSKPPVIHQYDKDFVRTIAKNYYSGLSKLDENDEIYTPKVINELVNCLKDEKENLIKLSKAFEGVSISNDKKEESNMSEKREEVAVSFYEGMISKEIINFKKGDSTIKMKRVKLPNDDPTDSQVRRSFLVKESAIGTDLKNPHMKYVYLGKDAEYKVVRKNFDPETRESKILEETKMTGQAIADSFKAERDRAYAEWKAQQPAQTENEFTNPDIELATEEDVNMDM